MTSSDLLSLADAMRAIGLHHSASLLDAAAQKAIARNESPTALLDHLVREERIYPPERTLPRA
jgi:hypothetical protein